MRGGLDGGEESNKLIRRGRDTIEPRQIQSRVDLAEYRVSGRRQLRPDRWISPPPPASECSTVNSYPFLPARRRETSRAARPRYFVKGPTAFLLMTDGGKTA